MFDDFQAKNTVCTPYIYGSSQPYSIPILYLLCHLHLCLLGCLHVCMLPLWVGATRRTDSILFLQFKLAQVLQGGGSSCVLD